jgi:peroxiredoxin Q/BCP
MRSESDSIKVGDPAPGFTLERATGGTVSLEALRGSPVVLYFFRGTW